MKLNELLHDFEIFTNNEEKNLLKGFSESCPYENFSEREKVIIENLIRKSLLTKVKHNGLTLVIKNEY